MHGPRDSSERELYDDQPGATGRIVPAWRLLAMTVVLYLLAAAVAVLVRSPRILSVETGALVMYDGLLVVLASGLLAGWAMIVIWGLLERAYRRWQSL